jgi:hypothetical protein
MAEAARTLSLAGENGKGEPREETRPSKLTAGVPNYRARRTVFHTQL